MKRGITKRKVIFITGTRADYGKIKSLMREMDRSECYDVYIYVTGMHILNKYGATYKEVLKDNYKNVHVAYGQQYGDNMSYNLGSVLTNFSAYVDNIEPDMIVVHGDRIEALAGAITGALNNIIIAHIEGGEISGTIDDSIRHAVSKFAHLHFVCNEEAKKRLMQLGEDSNRIFIIGSPDIDIMLSDTLPSIEKVKEYYEIPFDEYGIAMYHPVTTEIEEISSHVEQYIKALIESKKNYVVIYPNNDSGTELILSKIKKLGDYKNFKLFPSIRFEYFLTLLRNAEMIIGNSSAGIRESGVYGVPAIDIGSRQNRRYDINKLKNIQHVKEDEKEILAAIANIKNCHIKNQIFGDGNSTKKFLDIIEKEDIWNLKMQKLFIDR